MKVLGKARRHWRHYISTEAMWVLLCRCGHWLSKQRLLLLCSLRQDSSDKTTTRTVRTKRVSRRRATLTAGMRQKKFCSPLRVSVTTASFGKYQKFEKVLRTYLQFQSALSAALSLQFIFLLLCHAHCSHFTELHIMTTEFGMTIFVSYEFTIQ